MKLTNPKVSIYFSIYFAILTIDSISKNVDPDSFDCSNLGNSLRSIFSPQLIGHEADQTKFDSLFHIDQVSSLNSHMSVCLDLQHWLSTKPEMLFLSLNFMLFARENIHFGFCHDSHQEIEADLPSQSRIEYNLIYPNNRYNSLSLFHSD